MASDQHCRKRSGPSRLVGRHRIAIACTAARRLGGVCTCVRTCARTCVRTCVRTRDRVRVCERACVMCLQYSIKKYLSQAVNDNTPVIKIIIL